MPRPSSVPAARAVHRAVAVEACSAVQAGGAQSDRQRAAAFDDLVVGADPFGAVQRRQRAMHDAQRVTCKYACRTAARRCAPRAGRGRAPAHRPAGAPARSDAAAAAPFPPRRRPPPPAASPGSSRSSACKAEVLRGVGEARQRMAGVGTDAGEVPALRVGQARPQLAASRSTRSRWFSASWLAWRRKAASAARPR